MAFDQSTRGRLQKLVNSCRGLLSDEFSIQLQQTYGLDPKTGEVTPIARLTHLDDRQRHTAEVLRQTLAHYLGADADETDHRIAVLDRMVREQAFTVLNRLAALLMMEARGQLIESVSKGYQSRGYQLYSKIAGTALGETGQAYQVYLFSVFDELAQELPALFDRYAANGLLFPRETALRALLDELNHFEIEPLWAADETIGWIYQYFNSKEERKAMRDASQAPRNSRELAVRNQFFTPRYVVEFLVDNTLGRLWFNATGGQTDLRDRCQYLLVKPDEQPQVAGKLRDPRTLKLLDPACGSMHFGLYAFDLFAEIYREAWAWEQQRGPGSLDVSTQPQAALKPLSHAYEDETAFLRDVPRLIIEHNIYGVDIDPRAAQIATLALWLRAQRAWHDAGVKSKDRPLIGLGHVVAAIAPPAENELRQQFTANLDHRDAELFEKTLQLLKGLAELGVLLQIERELPKLIQQVYVGKGTGLFAQQEQESWQHAEVRLHEALTEFAQTAKSTYQGRLFALDALQGLRLINLCGEVFDVVVMNPPFGDAPESAKAYLKEKYSDWADNLYVAFHNRASMMLAKNGRVGVISSRTFIAYRDFEAFRKSLIGSGHIHALVDLGWGVLDGAQVETSAYVTSNLSGGSKISGPFIRLLDVPLDEKKDRLLSAWREGKHIFYKDTQDFQKLPGTPLCYWSSKEFVESADSAERLYPDKAYVGLGASPHAFFFRAWWEVPQKQIGVRWKRITRGGDFSPFFRSNALVIDWQRNGACVKEYILKVYPYLKGNYGWKIQDETYYGKPGITWGKRNERFNAQVMPAGHIFTDEGQGIVPNSLSESMFLLGYLNSSFVSYFLSLTSGLQKHYVYIRPIPIAVNDTNTREAIADAATRIVAIKQRWDATSELSPQFSPAQVFAGAPRTSLNDLTRFILERHAADCDQVKRLQEQIDRLVCENVALAPEDLDEIMILRSSWPLDRLSADGLFSSEAESPETELAKSICSYLMGVVFGRWQASAFFDGDMSDGSDPYGAIASQPPAMNDQDADNAIGVIATGDASVGQIGHALRQTLESLWGDSADLVEQEVLKALGSATLEDYFERLSSFFTDHLESYSKSRRKAPIYWPLSTASGSYTLWVYYASLNNQTLFTAVNDFLDGPNGKLTQVSRECAELRMKGSGRSRDEEKQYETLQTFEQELTDLRDTLLKIAPTYQPNHDDGVQITAAPLWQLFRHKPWQKVLKDTWSKLEKGDCDWAHLAIAYWPERVREKCKTDKSLAIAHGLEDLFIEPEAAPKKTRGRKKVGGEE
jgi:hypothetical protein